jgi:hypothetical protein
MVLSAALMGRALSANPSMAGSFPSDETSVFNAWTRCHAGLSTRALLEDWMSFRGPRPQSSPLAVISNSTMPFRAEIDRDDPVKPLRLRMA